MVLLSVISSTASILPAMTGDRIALLITCLLASVVYLDTLFKYLPESSTSFPIIIMWTLLNLAFTTLQIILASVCLNWANKEEKKKKPGKKAIFIVFYLLRYLIFFLPMIYTKIKECREARRRKVTVDMVDAKESSTVEEDAPKSNPGIDDADANSQEASEDSKKSFKNAIKIIDYFALLLSLVSLATIGAAVYIIMFSRKEVSMCNILSNL